MLLRCQFCDTSNETEEFDPDVKSLKKCNYCKAIILTWEFPAIRIYCNSSFVKEVEHNSETLHLTFFLHNGKRLEYIGVAQAYFCILATQESIGKYYHSHIRGKFLTAEAPVTLQDSMADKIIKLKIDVKKIKKEWLFVGEKGTYLDMTLLYNEEQDQYGNNGPIVQDVPKEIREKDKEIKGDILGNGKVIEKSGGKLMGGSAPTSTNVVDNLPF